MCLHNERKGGEGGITGRWTRSAGARSFTLKATASLSLRPLDLRVMTGRRLMNGPRGRLRALLSEVGWFGEVGEMDAVHPVAEAAANGG